jgi:hypothetical protein
MTKAGVVLVVLAVAGLAAGIWTRSRDPFDVQSLLAHPSASAEWQKVAAQAVERVTVGTRYASKWQINRAPSEGKLTIVLIDSDRLERAQPAAGVAQNCTYTGVQTLVICDVALVRRFLAERDLDKKVVSTFDADGHVTSSSLQLRDRASLDEDYRMMLEWILAHELGHILNGDQKTHFTSDRLEDPVSAASIDQSRELAADAFVARQFDGTKDDGFYLFLVGILQSEINRKACPDRSPQLSCPNIQTGVLIFSPNDYVRYSRKGTHPEYIIRMDRLLIEADERSGLGIIGPLARGLKQKLLEEGAPRPSA